MKEALWDSTKISQVIVALAAVGALVISAYNASQIKDVHIDLNSRLTELIELTKKTSKAEGVKEEKDRQDKEDEKEGK